MFKMNPLVSVSFLEPKEKLKVLEQMPLLLFEEHEEGMKTSKVAGCGGLSRESMATLRALHVVSPSPNQIVVVRDLHKVCTTYCSMTKSFRIFQSLSFVLFHLLANFRPILLLL